MLEDEDYIKALSYVKPSKNRMNVIKIIGTSMEIPSQIAKQMDLRVNQISAILKELKTENIVECINEEKRVGRLYRLTDTGLKVYEFIKDD